MKIVKNWTVFLLIIGVIAALIWYRHWIGQHIPERGTMTGPQVVIFALAFAFTWVEVLKWGSVKPFNCLKCMCGWMALILAFTFHVPFWPFYLPLGVFIGSIFSALKLRWL